MKKILLTAGLLAMFAASANAQLWTPADTTTALWFDAADASSVTEAGGEVSQWNDKSGNDRHATGVSGPEYVLGEQNGLNIIRLNGTEYFDLGTGLDFLAGGGGNATHSMFAILKNDNRVNLYGALTGGQDDASLHIGWHQDGNRYRMNRWGNDWYGDISENYLAEEYNFMRWTWNEGDLKIVHANAKIEGTSAAGHASTLSAMAGGGTIGNVVGQGLLDADIGELVLVAGSPDQDTIDDIEGYLAWKWGQEANLPSGHEYEFAPPGGEGFGINGGGQTLFQDFDVMETSKRLPRGWSGLTDDGTKRSAIGLGLTDGFLTVPGDDADGVLGVVNVGGNEDSFGPAPNGFVPTWTAELGGDNSLYGKDDAIADAAVDRALGVSRENNDDVGELNFEIEIADNNLRAFVLDWDLEIWGGDPDKSFRSTEAPGMAVDVTVGGTSYSTMSESFLPGDKFDSTEDGTSDHNATLIDGNVHSIRGMTSGIKEVSGADGAVGNMVQVNFNSNWNGVADDSPNGWMPAIDNVRLRALAAGDADANGVVNVDDLLALLGGQKFNKGVQGVTWAEGDFNADDQFDTSDLLAMLSFLSGTFPSDPYASEAGGASDAVADIIVNSETGEVTVDLAGHTVSAIIIESASEIFNGQQPAWDTTSQFPSTLPGELGNVLFTSTAAGTDELGAVISAEFLGRDKEFYLQDLDLNILIASEGGALTKGNVIVVPEPSTWMLLGLGSLAIVGVIRRRMA